MSLRPESTVLSRQQPSSGKRSDYIRFLTLGQLQKKRRERSWRHQDGNNSRWYQQLHTGTQSDSREIACPSQLTTRIHKAVITAKMENPNPDAKELYNDCTELFHQRCLDKRSCLLRVDECRSGKALKTPEGLQLVVQYSCEPSSFPKPLYDGTAFVEGVTGEFLVLLSRDKSAETSVDDRSLQRSMERCRNSVTCNYVTCDDAELHSDDYLGNKSGNRCAFYRPYRFKLPGYAVYINYTGVCKGPRYLKTKDFYEVAKIAKSQGLSFSVTYDNRSHPFHSPKADAWTCKGVPTIVPMMGSIVAIPAANL